MTVADEAQENGRRHNGRTFPIVRLLLYYGMLVLAGSVLIAFVPGFREALVAPITAAPASDRDDAFTGGQPLASSSPAPWTGLGGRGALTLTAMVWAFAMALPVAWALMRTRRLRYDPSLVHTLLILPIVVAGVVLVVKNSLALAFALAGIVAGVRFRQNLDEPEQAVYVLLALGIGLAAGVQALDVALVMSMAFMMVVMTLWRHDIGSIYAAGRGAQLAIGDASLLPRTTVDSEKIQARYAALGEGMEPDGILLVRTQDKSAARQSIEIVAGRLADEFRFTDPVTDKQGLTHFEVLLHLKKDSDPAEFVADLEARSSDRITAARYIPFGSPTDGQSESAKEAGHTKR